MFAEYLLFICKIRTSWSWLLHEILWINHCLLCICVCVCVCLCRACQVYGCGSKSVAEIMCWSVAVLLMQAMLRLLRVWTDTQAASGVSRNLIYFLVYRIRLPRCDGAAIDQLPNLCAVDCFHHTHWIRYSLLCRISNYLSHSCNI